MASGSDANSSVAGANTTAAKLAITRPSVKAAQYDALRKCPSYVERPACLMAYVKTHPPKATSVPTFRKLNTAITTSSDTAGYPCRIEVLLASAALPALSVASSAAALSPLPQFKATLQGSSACC
eukprot:GHRR01014371.1.p1 GENE.GHRR01014371.1~~GHRR01014371.1.p1  ORF type:complete len:125 (-),score=43.07 GHRR01014371.1:1223-1597(-)